MSIFDKDWLNIAKTKPSLYGWLLESESGGFFQRRINNIIDNSDNISEISDLSGVDDIDDEKEPFETSTSNNSTPLKRPPTPPPDSKKPKQSKRPPTPSREIIQRSKSVVDFGWRSEANRLYKVLLSSTSVAHKLSSEGKADYDEVVNYLDTGQKVGDFPNDIDFITKALSNEPPHAFSKEFLKQVEAGKKLRPMKRSKSVQIIDPNTMQGKVQTRVQNQRGATHDTSQDAKGIDDEPEDWTQENIITKTSKQVQKADNDAYRKRVAKKRRALSEVGIKPTDGEVDYTAGVSHLHFASTPPPDSSDDWDD